MATQMLPANFWLPSHGEPRAPSTQEIEELETRYKVKIPPIVHEIWRTNPGSGRPRDRMYVWPTESTHTFQDFKILFFSDYESIDLQTKMVGGILNVEDLGKIQMLAIGEPEIGQEIVCLDFRSSGPNGPPSVTYAAFGSDKLVEIAPSLEEFIKRLQRYHTDDCYCLEWSGRGVELWRKIVREFGQEVGEGEFGIRHEWDISFSLKPNVDGDMREPFIEFPADRWILKVSANKERRSAVRQSLNNLQTPWVIAYESND